MLQSSLPAPDPTCPLSTHHLSQRRDDLPQGCQGLVDVGTLLFGQKMVTRADPGQVGQGRAAAQAPPPTMSSAWPLGSLSGDTHSLTLRRVPLAPVESARSLPARSTKLILLTWRQKQHVWP